ncbi:hypothetical protein [Thalassobacter stenotrophicus]|uniref:hypothetical protein n=1 Tax=Thalassobacter stenotrophicus TaxID=266809 RepID=UPI000D5EA4C9|nr:hypothetical protein [Thalassobacter stenotrophicus]PVZ45930.1 hypothetical protein DD557_16980 [Thalassobacter stenotrophicus]
MNWIGPSDWRGLIEAGRSSEIRVDELDPVEAKEALAQLRSIVPETSDEDGVEKRKRFMTPEEIDTHFFLSDDERKAAKNAASVLKSGELEYVAEPIPRPAAVWQSLEDEIAAILDPLLESASNADENTSQISVQGYASSALAEQHELNSQLRFMAGELGTLDHGAVMETLHAVAAAGVRFGYFLRAAQMKPAEYLAVKEISAGRSRSRGGKQKKANERQRYPDLVSDIRELFQKDKTNSQIAQLLSKNYPEKTFGSLRKMAERLRNNKDGQF